MQHELKWLLAPSGDVAYCTCGWTRDEGSNVDKQNAFLAHLRTVHQEGSKRLDDYNQ